MCWKKKPHPDTRQIGWSAFPLPGEMQRPRSVHLQEGPLSSLIRKGPGLDELLGNIPEEDTLEE